MSKQIKKIIIQFVFVELLFLFLLNLGLTFLPHQGYPFIYYVHINIYYLIACFTFQNYLYSKLDRVLILVFFSSAFILTLIPLITLFAFPDYQTANYFLFYNLLSILVNAVFTFSSFYLYIYISNPYKNLLFHINISLIFTVVLSIIICWSLFISGEIYQYSIENLNSMNNKVFLANFTVLLLFWNEYSKQKHNLSEYLSIVIAIYTIIIGFEIIHIFLMKNDLVFLHNLGQYFTAILNLLMLTTWIIRFNYLQSPQSKENERYIKNYKVLYGLVEKPRTGLFERVYHKTNVRIIWIFIFILCLSVTILFVFNQLNLFVKKNIFLLTISLIVSILFAIMYWDKRWYRAIGFLIKKKKE